MEYKVYQVIADRIEYKPDMDGIYYESYEDFFNDLFPSRVSAIRKAQKLASRFDCYVRVLLVKITERGKERGQIVYRKH